jgi:predicted amidohydrolase YtcJ
MQLTRRNAEEAKRRGKLWRFDPKTDTLTIPGLKDCHTHPFIYALLRAANPIDISGCKTIPDLQKALKRRKGPGLILATGLDTNHLSHLTGAELDNISKKDNIILVDPSFHGGVMNGKAASIINAKGKDLKGELNPDGKWKGEEYLDLCLDLCAKTMKRDDLYSEVVSWLNEQTSRGIVEIHDMKVPSILGLELLAQAREDLGDDFPITNVHVGIQTARELIANAELRRKLGENFEGIGLKLFSDGSIGSSTAAMFVPYTGTENSGRIFQELAGLSRFIGEIKGSSVRELLTHAAIHAIGDRGINNSFRLAQMLKCELEMQTRIEHFELSGNSGLLFFAKELRDIGVLEHVTMNPNFTPNDSEQYAERLGNRIMRLNPLRAILNFEIPMKFGTDGMPQDMLRAVYDAVYHPVQEQRITLDDALTTASGVGAIEKATVTISLKGNVVDSLLSGSEYSDEGEVRVIKQ